MCVSEGAGVALVVPWSTFYGGYGNPANTQCNGCSAGDMRVSREEGAVPSTPWSTLHGGISTAQVEICERSRGKTAHTNQ